MTDATPMPSVPSAAGHGVYRSDSTLPAKSRCSLPPERRGRLKNGNRCGDFLGAPRCGARARWKHGARSAEVTALRRAARAQLRRVGTILCETRLSAGHGVHRSKPQSAVGARCARPATSTRAPSSAISRVSNVRARAARPYTTRSNERVSAWHGVLRSFRDRLRASASFSAIVPVLRSPAPTNR
jgi:hypothetical protein